MMDIDWILIQANCFQEDCITGLPLVNNPSMLAYWQVSFRLVDRTYTHMKRYLIC